MGDDDPVGENSSLQSITIGASLHITGKLVSKILAFLLNLILTRGLGASLYGVYAYATTIISFLVIFARFGSGKAILRFIPVFEDDSKRQNQVLGLAYVTAIIGSTAAGIILYVLAPTVSAYTLNNPILVDVLRIFAIVLPFKAILQLTNAVFRGLERMELQVITNDLARPLINILFAGSAILVGFSLQGAVISLAVGAILVSGFAVSILITKTTLRPNIFSSRSTEEVYDFYNFSIPLTLKDVGQYLYRRIDILMVGFFLLETDVGIYQISILLAGFLTLPLTAFNQLFPPVAARLHSEGKEDELDSIYKRVTRWTVTIAIPPALVVLLYSEEVLSVFGPEFTAGSLVLVLFTIAQLTNCAVGPSGFVLMMTDHQYLNLANQWVLGVLNVIFNYFLILEYGLVGAALATAGVLTFINIVRLFEVWHIEGLFPYSQQYWKPIVSGILTALLMYLVSWSLDGFLLLITGGTAGFILFTILLLSFGVGEEDREFFRNLVASQL